METLMDRVRGVCPLLLRRREHDGRVHDTGSGRARLTSLGVFLLFLLVGPARALAAPTISTLTPTSGAVGASVTIAGTGFGATQGTSTVKFNGTTATTISSWNATSIVATVPTGATTGNVVVTVSGVA